MNKSNQAQTGNIKIIESKHDKNFKTLSLYHLYDKSLTIQARGILTILLTLPNNFKITTKATSKFLNINEKTFYKVLNELRQKEYLITKTNGNKTTYIIKDMPNKIDFNPYLIKSYTLKQLNYFYNSALIETKYKNLIKKALEKTIKGEQELKKLIDEIEQNKAE